MSTSAEPGFWRRTLRRLRSSSAELEADELLSESRGAGGTPIADCQIGQQVTVSGRIRSVTLCPSVGVAEVQAELYDGSGKVRLIWLGRRRINGIAAGREILVTGRFTLSGGEPTIYNPSYRLRAVATGG